MSYQPNAHLIGVEGSRARLATPSLVLDLDALEHNIKAMADFCAAGRIALRPHVKTHKSVRVAKMQIEAGANGICAATLREAWAMVGAGITDIHLTSPLLGEVAMKELTALLAHAPMVSVVADSIKGVAGLEKAMYSAGLSLRVLVDVDLGAMYRTGVARVADAVALAQRIDTSPVLEYDGLQFYSGIVQHITPASERAAYHDRQLQGLKELIAELESTGLPPKIVTGGGTGTFALDADSRVLTENQAGSYAVMDVEYAAVEVLTDDPAPFRPALFVLSSVVSNNQKGMVTIDAGSKSVALDGPKPLVVRGAPSDATFQILGDEHAGLIFPGAMDADVLSGGAPPPTVDKPIWELFYELFDAMKGDRQLLEVGTRVELMAPHCDPTVNLFNHYHCVRGDTLVDIWPVDARGST